VSKAQPPTPGDQAKVTVLVRVPPEDAFAIFTTEIDQWWRRGPRFRASGKRRGILHLEPHEGGRLFESIETASGETVVETGRVTAWEPPSRLVLTWRATNFAPSETTEVEVTFAASPSGTQVTVVHRGWSKIRSDHPVRHGADVPTFVRSMALYWSGLLSALRVHAEAPPAT
jgi:uncharacterized protein YndB with AHSA1/START domain